LIPDRTSSKARPAAGQEGRAPPASSGIPVPDGSEVRQATRGVNEDKREPMTADRSRSPELVSPYEGATVRLRGWVYQKRSSGKIRFLVLRDGQAIASAWHS